jgi:hypothetical protein
VKWRRISQRRSTDNKDRVIDDKRPGFGLMMTASAKRSFVFRYRSERGRSTPPVEGPGTWRAQVGDILQGDAAEASTLSRRERPIELHNRKRENFGRSLKSM